jgi:hypothetical protein
MGTDPFQTADSGDAAARRRAAGDGRAAAMSRRRALAAGRSALAPAPERVRTGSREAGLRAFAVAVDATSSARLGRALSMQRRRQLSQGKQALNDARGPVFIVHHGGGR